MFNFPIEINNFLLKVFYFSWEKVYFPCKILEKKGEMQELR